MNSEFREAYLDLDARMRALAEGDGDVYLPSPEPVGHVDHIFICMEPSLGRWAGSTERGRERVRDGFRNFLAGVEPMLLHYAARKFLCAPEEQYYITDFSKGAMFVKHAGRDRRDRYARWWDLLNEEVELIGKPGAKIFAVGNAVAHCLRQHCPQWRWTSIIHYSPLASGARAKRLRGLENQFQDFASQFSHQDFFSTARLVLNESRVPETIVEEAYSIITRSKLSESRLKLIFCYKLEFESVSKTRNVVALAREDRNQTSRCI